MKMEELRKLLDQVHEVQVGIQKLPVNSARDSVLEFARRIACYIEDEIDVLELNLRAETELSCYFPDEFRSADYYDRVYSLRK